MSAEEIRKIITLLENVSEPLKPCPFCGETRIELHPAYVTKGAYHWPKITCANGHSLRLYSTDKNTATAEARLIDAWNSRTSSL